MVGAFSLRGLNGELHKANVSHEAMNYFLSFFGAAILFMVSGFDSWVGGAMGVMILATGSIGAYRSAFFKWVASFSMFSRFMVYFVATWPFAGIVAYYRFGPWGEAHRFTIIVGILVAALMITAAFFDIHLRVSRVVRSKHDQ